MSEAERLQVMAVAHQAQAEQLAIQARIARARDQVAIQYHREQRIAAHDRHYDWAQSEEQRRATQEASRAAVGRRETL